MTDTVTVYKARAQRLMAERMRLMERLRKAQWAFDRDPTADNAKTLRVLRDTISDKENQIVMAHQTSKALEIAAGKFLDEFDKRTMVIS